MDDQQKENHFVSFIVSFKWFHYFEIRMYFISAGWFAAAACMLTVGGLHYANKAYRGENDMEAGGWRNQRAEQREWKEKCFVKGWEVLKR